ncbi:MAG: DNA starvation/stationary phase protection protein [Paracoccaceae bacterium]
MADVMEAVAKSAKVETGVQNVDAVVKALAGVLSDTYRLLIKSHVYHWNVEGPLFYSIHHLTEEQYKNLFAASDELAERIRALGKLTPVKISDIVKSAAVGDTVSELSAIEMVEDLVADHEQVAQRLHALIKIADENNDPVTADMATGRSAFHEKAAWMLRATAAS